MNYPCLSSLAGEKQKPQLLIYKILSPNKKFCSPETQAHPPHTQTNHKQLLHGKTLLHQKYLKRNQNKVYTQKARIKEERNSKNKEEMKKDQQETVFTELNKL